jgi:chemotaxis protein MotA
MDLATTIGLVMGLLALVGGFTLEGGSVGALINFPSAVIVFGGTIGASLITMPLSGFLQVPKVMTKAFFAPKEDGAGLVETFVNLAERARREGLLSLEQEAQKLEQPLLRKGVMLVVDGMEPEAIETIIENEIDAMKERHEHSIGFWEAMGGFSPTMGIIGTVMGLVNVLSHLSDPSELGHKIAGAFIATLYGVMFANVVALPIAGKLKRRSADEAHLQEVILVGIQSIQAGDNPRLVKEKLEAFLPPSAKKDDTPVAEAGGALAEEQAA